MEMKIKDNICEICVKVFKNLPRDFKASKAQELLNTWCMSVGCDPADFHFVLRLT